MGTTAKSSTMNYLRITNSRGRKPVVRDIEKAYSLINNIMVMETGDSPGRKKLKKIDILLWELIYKLKKEKP
jgi:hypothetical protein